MSLWFHCFRMILALIACTAWTQDITKTRQNQHWNITVLMYDEESEKCDENAEEEAGIEYIYRTATDKAIADASLPASVNINVDFVALGDDCIQSGGLLSLVRLINSPSVQAVIGTIASPMCRAAATFTRMRGKLFVSWGCLGLSHINPFSPPPYLPPMDQYGVEDAVTYFNDTADVLGAESLSVTSPTNKSKIVRRYFYRISPPAVTSARALVQIIKHFRWKQSAIIVSEDDGWLSLANRIDVALREEDFIVRHFIVLHRHGDQHHVRDKLASILPQVKAIILCVPVNSLEMHYVMQKAAELRMLSGQRCAFMAVHVRHPFIPPLSLTTARNFSLTPTPLVFTYVPPNATYDGALENNKFQNAINVTKDEEYQLFYRVYDCVALMMSVLISRMLWREQEFLTEEVQMEMDSITARGFLGPILSTPADGVKVHYTLLHYEHRHLSHRPLLYVRDGNLSFVDGSASALLHFPTGDSACDFGNKDACNTSNHTDRNLEPLGLVHLVVIIISSAFLCLGLICAVFLIRRILLRREMTKGPYGILIYPGDLVMIATRPHHTTNKHVNDFHSMEKPDLLKGSHDSLRGFTFNSNSTVIEDGITRARYNGDLVLVKYFQTRGFELRNKAIKELRIMHDLRHENVNTFLGYFVNPERPALVFEYCTRGSLQDVLSSENIKLDWSFKLSLLTDIVRGVKYLHSSPVRVHGRLTSRNCVIDSRWVLKITDYGQPNFYTAQSLPFPKSSATALLWAAPELLRNETALRRGTQAGDVYSFSIIMQEVLVRGLPYCMLPLTPSEIIEKVKHPPPMIRPSVSKQAAPPEAINIMRECWAEVPDMRPDFAIIYEQFKRLNHGKKVNIVDTMFQMLEKYSNNLEEIIRERTEQLAEEKKKTEQLLHRMLPSSVAERLKIGMPVEPEAYEEVTIYFSDIVGFTTISAYSTPMEVVDLLNDLYTCFDATIDGYNVYKVETIGDAYMVVGGLPVRIEDHACQVANMAMDLLHQSGKFKITHLPNTPLKLRIGIHTGPCCAGVVGLTMPRYCLFGDTVNTASRLESTGHAWRIHISQTTKDKLDRCGGYHITCRGVIELKGKGKATTYWLHGKDGFDKPLPLPTDLDDELIRQCLASSQRTADAANQCILTDDQSESGLSAGQEPRSSVGSDDIVQHQFARTHSNASDIIPSRPSKANADTQSLHSQSHVHLRAQPRKALEFIPNANSYIINMNRAHSLDSDEPSGAAATGKMDPGPSVSGSSGSTGKGERNATSGALDRTLTLHLLSRTSAGSGIDNHCHHPNRRSSEVWENNVYSCKDRNQNARRFSNPRYYGLVPSDERNGNFLSSVPGSAGSGPDGGSSSGDSTTAISEGGVATILPYRDVIDHFDNRVLDSSF